MSGIAGVVRADGVAVGKREFQTLTDALRPQGPDGRKTIFEHNLALGHALLQTDPDAPPEHQPLTIDGDHWIVADTRLDDRRSLVQAIRRDDPHAPNEASDAELLLRAYRVWGPACLDRLLGEFAFAIWSQPAQRLFCARDHFGLKPFYFSSGGARFVFSNTPDCIRRDRTVSGRLNEAAVGDFLLFDYNRDPRTTILAGVQRLPPAHSLTWSGGQPEIQRYWRMPIDDELRWKDPRDYVVRFRELLEMAVADRMRSGKTGILMSGGMDSTSLAAAAKELAGKRKVAAEFKAFTIAYDRLIPDDERRYASSAARHMGLPISTLAADGYGFFERSGEPGFQPPEPQNTPFYAVWMDHFREAAEFSRVALAGYGGDEILEQRSAQLLSLVRGMNLGAAVREWIWCARLRRRIPHTGFLPAVRSKLRREDPWQPVFPRWIDPEFAAAYGLYDRWREGMVEPDSEHPRHPVDYSLMGSPIWPATFEAFHPGATGRNLEVRTPFLDLRLARFALSLPVRPWLEDKGVLRAAMRGRLPRQVLNRWKTPLNGSPEEVHVKRGTHLNSMGNLHPELFRFVDRDRFFRTMESDGVEALEDLRPLALSKYLDHLRPATTSTRNRHAA